MKREPSAADLDRLEAIQRANPPRWWAAAERKQRTADGCAGWRELNGRKKRKKRRGT